MELGLSTYSFPWSIGVTNFIPQTPLHFSKLITYTSKNHIKHLQFADNLPLNNLSKKTIAEIKERCHNLGINIQVGTRRLTKENIEMYLEIAQQLLSPFLRVVIDDKDFHPQVDEIIKIIHSLLPSLEEKNICLAIENHDRFKAKTLKHIITKTSEKYVGICLDTANSFGAGEGIDEILPVLLPYTINLHIKDFNIERVKHKMGFNIYGTVAGKGMLNIPQLIEQCRNTEKCKTATLEIWMNKEATPEQTMLKEQRWVEQSLNYLKKYIS